MTQAAVLRRPAPANPALMSLTEAAAAIRARELSSVEATRAALARVGFSDDHAQVRHSSKASDRPANGAQHFLGKSVWVRLRQSLRLASAA
jgi:hypothetical protein